MIYKTRKEIYFSLKQKRLSSEQAVRVSVTEYEETDTDDAFLVERERPAEIDFSPSRKSPPVIPGINDEYFRLEEARFQGAGEKVWCVYCCCVVTVYRNCSRS